MRKSTTYILALTSLFLVLPCVAQEAAPVAEAATPAMPAEIIFESSVGDVMFPHNIHLKFGCSQCHHQIQAGKLETPHPEYLESSWVNCQDCHDPEQARGSPYYKCSVCHHSEPDNISDETLSSKVVTHESCWKCHKSGTGVEASTGCGDCHEKDEPAEESSNG